MAPEEQQQIARLRDEIFETIAVLTQDHAIDFESSQLVDRLQVIAYEIGQLEQAS